MKNKKTKQRLKLTTGISTVSRTERNHLVFQRKIWFRLLVQNKNTKSSAQTYHFPQRQIANLLDLARQAGFLTCAAMATPNAGQTRVRPEKYLKAQTRFRRPNLLEGSLCCSGIKQAPTTSVECSRGSRCDLLIIKIYINCKKVVHRVLILMCS